MGRIINIPLSGPLVLQPDQEDLPIGVALSTKNFEVDKPGEIYKRKGRKTLKTVSSKTFSQIIKWVHAELSGDEFSDGSSYDGTGWIVYDTTNDTIEIYDTSFTAAKALKDLVSGVADIKILNFKDKVRFANGLTKAPGVLQYIDRKFFHGGWTPTNEFLYDSIYPGYPTTWNYYSTTFYSYGGAPFVLGETIPMQYRSYKIVPKFDGKQLAPFADESFDFRMIDGTRPGLDFRLDKGAGDFNKRITSLEVYRSSNAVDVEAAYRKVMEIPLNTDSSHEDIGTPPANTNIGYALYDPSASMTNIEVGDYIYLPEKHPTLNYEVSNVDNKASGYVIVSDSFVFGSTVSVDLWNEEWECWTGIGGSGTKHASGTAGCAGTNVVFVSGGTYKVGELMGWILVDSNGAEYGILENNDKAIRLHLHPTVSLDYTWSNLTKNYFFTITSDTINIFIFDNGIIEGLPHPLDIDGKDIVEVNFEFAQYLNKRLFTLNNLLDPNGVAEAHPNWLMYSEEEQPDIIPIKNYQQIWDIQGGNPMGLSKVRNDLAILMSKGIYRLRVPTARPSDWELIEDQPDIGCNAKNSVLRVGSFTFFGGTDHIYAILPDFTVIPITTEIKDTYQAAAGSGTRIIYDPLKARLLISFGSDVTNIYTFELTKWKPGENEFWNMLDAGSDDMDLFAIDENMVMYALEVGSNTEVWTLKHAVGTESFAVEKKIGFFSLSDLGHEEFVRKLNMRYVSTDIITLTLYTDDDDSTVVWTNTYPANNSSGKKYYSIDVGRRAKTAMIKITTPASTTINTTISRLEMEVD